jgi:hypothetical protein
MMVMAGCTPWLYEPRLYAGVFVLPGGHEPRAVQLVMRSTTVSRSPDFYLRCGYEVTGPQTPEGVWPMTKELLA